MEGGRKGKTEEMKDGLRCDKSSLELNSWLCQRRCDNHASAYALNESHTTFNKFQTLIAFQSTITA